MSKETKVVGVSVNEVGMTLYIDDGEVIDLLQGDERLGRLVDRVVAGVEKDGFIVLTEEDLKVKEPVSIFDQMNKMLSNQIRLVQMQLDDLMKMQENITKGQAQILDKVDLKPVSLGTASKSLAQEILSKGASKGIKAEKGSTVVAVVNGSKVIPGMEKLANQFDRALKLGSAKGVEAFLKRISAVIDDRGHSIDDLLKFMENGDLPITDNGEVVAYKTLNQKKDDSGEVTLVDCHSGNVTQWLATKVFMHPSLVDPDRRNDCSNGLHVARRQYLRGFQGSVLTIVLIDPEDFIAVPQYDSNKVRVCGYHIVYICNEQEKNLIFSNNPMTTESETRKVLGNIIAGNHVGIAHTVEIGGPRGSNLTVKKNIGTVKEVSHVEELQETALDTSEDVLAKGKHVAKVDTAKVAKAARKAKQDEATVDTPTSQKGNIRDEYDVVMGCVTPHSFGTALKKFDAVKKGKKKSLAALGFTPEEIAALETKKTEFQNLSNAIEAVKNGKSQTAAASEFGVSRKKLAKYL